MKSNSAIKSLVNVFGKVNHLKVEEKLLNIYKIPNHYQNYQRLTLYFGDWRKIEADCLYLKNRKEYERLLVLTKISNLGNSKMNDFTHFVNEDNNQLIDCSNVLKNCKFVYFGNLTQLGPRENLKSLIVPLDFECNYLNNFEDFNFSGPSKESKGTNCFQRVSNLVKLLEGLTNLDKVLLCAHNNETWHLFHNHLKYSQYI